MKSARRERIDAISKLLGADKLVWFGTRGTDSQALLQLPQFAEVFSIIAPLESLSLRNEVCLESLTGRRVDLDRYSIDYDDSPGAREFIARLYLSLGEPAWVAMYRPGAFFTSIYYPRCDYVKYLGQFHERQAPFEHKPWVESELRGRGVRVVPWRYFGDGDKDRLEEYLRPGAMVLRSSRSDGGAGLALVRNGPEAAARWPVHSDRFLGAAPYMVPNVPLNVNAVVFRDGKVSLHAPSLQLIGLPDFTSRTFGYCGNDFAQIRYLPTNALDQLEQMASISGEWLASMGYVGAFGVDAMYYEDEVYLAEINPRFQGSSHLASQLDIEMGRPDMFLEHIAAFLGLPAPAPVPLRELADGQRKAAQIVCHNISPTPVKRTQTEPPAEGDTHCTLLPAHDVIVDPEAILFRAVIQGSVTEDGMSLHPARVSQLRDLISGQFEAHEDCTEGGGLVTAAVPKNRIGGGAQ